MRILYLDIDTMRADHLSCYGYLRQTTPNIDRLCADSLRLDNCYVSDAPCLPSRGSMFTGQFGIHSGIVGHGGTAADWRIIGRVKSILIPESGHNVAPEPIEHELIEACDGLEQAFIVGHARPYLAVLISGDAEDKSIQEAIEKINEAKPHYKKIRAFCRVAEPFTAENGLLTANGKLKRKAIEAHFKADIERIYAETTMQPRPAAGGNA